MRQRLLVAIAICVCSSSCEDASRTQSGAELLQPFKLELMQALESGLEDGPVQAIEVCQLRAPQIADALSRDGVRMGRSSHKLRNPDNAGPAWVRPVLEGYLESGSAWEPQTVAIGDGYKGYVEPIVTQPLCLACHGDPIAPDLEAKLGELYPDDRARAFRAGELRGVFWVEYPADR